MSFTVNKNYSTPNGDYYLGMTRKEAEDKGIYKKTVGIDFYDIDTNKNDVLDIREIDVAWEKQCTRNMLGGLTESLSGVTLVVIGGIVELPSFFSSTPVLVSGAGMVVDGVSRMMEALTDPGQIGLRGFVKQSIKGSLFQEK